MILTSTFKAATASLMLSAAPHLPERAAASVEQAFEGISPAQIAEDLRAAAGDLQRLVKIPSHGRRGQSGGVAFQGQARGPSPLVASNLMAGLPLWLFPAAGVLGVASALLVWRLGSSGRIRNPFDNRAQKLRILADEINVLIRSNSRPGEIMRKRLQWAELMVSLELKEDPSLKLQVVICEQYFRSGGSGRGRTYKKELIRVAEIKRILGMSPMIIESLKPLAMRELFEEFVRYHENRPDQDDRTRAILADFRAELAALPHPVLQDVVGRG